MAMFVMLGKYSSGSVKGISAERTRQAEELITRLGGRVQSVCAMLGPYDLLLIVEFPDVKQAMKASLGLAQLTDIAFTTCPAVSVEEFDQLAAEV
ncbi:MAG TPA: GYD domain-containing protein [Planctomycetaceae bacterium]|nr:GYD domain-containing protein [Planctomycetaceae bacterium]